jgi:hypothetical protein
MSTRIRSSRTITRATARFAAVRTGSDRGMATAEYAVGTVAAAGLAGLLVSVLKSDVVMDLLLELIKRALSFVL